MIEEINKIIEQYNKYSSSMNVGQLLDIQDKLACSSYYLAEITGKATEDYNGYHFNRKVFANRKKNNLVKAKTPVSKAEIEVFEDEEVLALWKEERKKEGEAFKCDLLLKQINKILSSMQQRISHLKQEQQITKTL